MTLNTTQISILDQGLKMWPKFTSRGIAKELGLHCSNITYYFRQDELETAIARRAITTRNLDVIGQLVAAKHPVASEIPLELKQEALSRL
mgnify:CR=1 FL=1